MAITFDIECTDLLNEDTIDYTKSPYELRDNFLVHCVVVEEHETGTIVAFYDGDKIELDGTVYEGDNEFTTTLEDYDAVEYVRFPLAHFPEYIASKAGCKVIAHNSINYDFLVCKLWYKMDYSISPDTWNGACFDIVDTLVESKALNPDRFGGHSLDHLGELAGMNKLLFRKKIAQNKRFKKFAPDMLYYNIIDVKVNTKVYHYLEKEKAGWNWEKCITLEKEVAELITRQEHRGFFFDTALAKRCVPELDKLISDAETKIEPILPSKTPTKGFQKTVTPPVTQIKNDGSRNSYIVKFVEKHKGEFFTKNGAESWNDEQDLYVRILGKEYKLPIPVQPLIDKVPCELKDTSEIKEWLVGLGWVPSEWGERDLTMYADKKKGKLPVQKYIQTIEKYVDKTLNSTLTKERCDYLGVSKGQLKSRLLKHKQNRPLKVPTNPKFTVGQEKEICPNLMKLSESFPYAKDIVEYLTYKHRRNSILGGGVDVDGHEEAGKGYLANVREDGRIPTPANTCGAGTSRFTHKLVANIPRVTSLYGDKMRSMFGVGEGFYQLGYDFDSLEAKMEADGVYLYDGGKEYGESLTANKPNDCHSVLAKELSEILGYEFPRQSAKPVKYGCAYNAQPARLAKTLGCNLDVAQIVFDVFWKKAKPLKLLKEAMQRYWEGVGQKKFLLGLDGRKLPIRSKGNVINTRFQSSGVICAKKAMVLHDRKLKEEGFYVDFFLDDWKNKQFCQQMIAYHDEGQSEVSSSLVKIKSFSSKEEAEEWKIEWESENNKILSDVGHRGDIYYVGYCRAGELALEAVKESGEYYGLKVELTAGYMLGKNWADCH